MVFVLNTLNWALFFRILLQVRQIKHSPMLQKETRRIKSRGVKTFEFEDQAKLYLIRRPGNMQPSSDASEGQD